MIRSSRRESAVSQDSSGAHMIVLSRNWMVLVM